MTRGSGPGFVGIPARLIPILLAVLALRVAGFVLASVIAGGADAAVWAWDGELYRGIAESGYPPGVPLETAGSWAFFPIWPAILAILIRLPVDPTISVVGLGLVMSVVDTVLLVRLLEPKVGTREAGLVAIAWAAFPPNWVYLAAYSEGVFIALELLLLLAIDRRQPLRVTGLAFIIGLARPQGAFWALAAAIWLLRSSAGLIGPAGRRFAWIGRLILPAFAVAGAGIWQIVVSVATGIPGGWFAVEKLPGWEMGFGILPFTTSVEAILALADGVVDRRLAMVPVVIAAIVAIVGLIRRREELPGRWTSAIVATNALFVSGGIGGIPRFMSGAPLLILGFTKPISGRLWREVLFVLVLAAASAAFAVYNLGGAGSNP